MNASAKLQIVSAVDAPSAGISGRGFRGGFRIEAGASPALIIVGDSSVVGRVTEFSPEHVVMEWPVGRLGQLKSLTTARMRVRGFDEVQFGVRPGMSNLRDRRGEIGLDITAPTKDVARALLARGKSLLQSRLATTEGQRAPIRELIASDERPGQVLDALARNGFEGTVRMGEYPIGRATLTSTAGEDLEWRFSGPDVSGAVRIEVPGYNSLFVVEVGVEKCERGVLRTSRPTSILRLRHRAARRVDAADGLAIEFRHPIWPRLNVRRAVREISSGGISFATNTEEDLLYPGVLAWNATLYAGERAMTFMGEVRSISERGLNNREYCGMRVLPDSAEDDATWQAIVDEHLYPTTRKGASWAGRTWDLYRDAGYFNLSGKATDEFEKLQRSFESVSQKIDDAPHLGCQVVWADEDNNVEAALSILKPYSTSWFGYQMAKVSGDTRGGVLGRLVLRDIHLHCYEHAQRDGNLKWLIGIPQVRPVWSRLVHHDMPARYIESGQAAVVRFRAVEIASEEGASAPSEYEVGVATADESTQLLAEIARTRPTAYVEALDFVAERFDLAELCEDWSQAGLGRRRSVLVARREGKAVAAAVLESAEEGTHLFRLLDLVRLFPLVPGGDDANAALLDATCAWFRAMEKSAFVAYLENDIPVPASFTGTARDLGLADFVILSAELLPELLEHVVEVTAPREPPPAKT